VALDDLSHLVVADDVSNMESGLVLLINDHVVCASEQQNSSAFSSKLKFHKLEKKIS
jgi:hypothetical protein